MKKENRKMAQEARAKERRKKEQQQKIKKVLAVAIPVIIIIAFIAAIILSWQPSDQESTGSTETAGSSETASETESETAALTLSDDPSLTIEDGDTVNIDYVGTVDGAEFEGGNTEGSGTDLVIGSNRYIDDFEEQLIGHHPGEEVEVNVTFPDDYTDDLKGKDAVFQVTINGIYR